MTEKRFTFMQDTLVKADVFDNGEFVCCTLSVWVEQLVDLLNSLSEENMQLKVQLEICKDARRSYKQDWKACVSYCDTYKDEIHTLKDNIQGLIEENKQLKKDLFEAEKDYLWASSDDVDRALYFEKEVEELRKEIFGDDVE